MKTDPNCLLNTLKEVQLSFDHIFDYWMNAAFNRGDNTFFGEVDFYGNSNPEADKCIIMYSRILWSFAAAYNHTKNPDYLPFARHCYDFLINFFYDKVNNGFFWSTTFKGVPVIKKKQTYAQAFVLYAFAEYYQSINEVKVLEKAMSLFETIEKRCLDNKAGGYFEAFSENWQILDDVSLSDKDQNDPKGMNTNLHILEAYTRLLQITNDDHVKSSLKSLIEIYIKHIFNDQNHVVLFFDENWNPRSNIISYGHDIEASWLIWDAAKTINDEGLCNIILPFVLKIAKTFKKEGIFNKGAVVYEYFPDSNKADTDRHWWTQVEAIEGLCNAYRLNQDQSYLDSALDIWNYTYTYFPDKTNGEWHSVIKEDNTPDTKRIKTGAWKTPYHISRALIRFETFLNKLVSNK
ncbi:MAG: AGE family epimerase/isomerase [Spirochaetes bacterium]|nr:AGE family epimerase/isomerase [Spirochaetota bacterium]MBN2770362.1 AGE family epimerase/isomerase [Spirochaetota bacterium]